MNSPKNGEVKSYPNIVKTGGTWLACENKGGGFEPAAILRVFHTTASPNGRGGDGEQRSSGR